MSGPVCVCEYGEPPVRLDEVLRYAGAGGTAQESILRLAEECAGLVRGRLSCRVCWREYPIRFDQTGVDLGFSRTDSAALRRRLAGCDRIVLFAATIGLEMDRLIARSSVISPAQALMLQAVGAERIESLCDLFCRDVSLRLAVQARRSRPRFSPGYGDLPLEMQKDIFLALDCSRQIGLTLNGSLLMSPSKSVTAVIGVEKDGQDAKESNHSDNPNGTDQTGASAGCVSCAADGCPYRKERCNEDH